MDDKSMRKRRNRDLTRQEKRWGLVAVTWFALCIWIAIFIPKLGFGLLLAGLFVVGAISFVI
ncbi:MAG: hypothetical protein DRR11_11485 [Gammaproteobacteria bacterium]|nr:MAG: hypothetical protein DRR11_11485 [Gammaproteobacteria bacterium]RLA34674.1 MAG: hypothetical protein DRR15_08700 [Gammaproteobacteria bacterium]